MTGSKRFGEKVVVTYINRQGVRRHLVEEDHDRLVRDLEDMAHRNHWELNVVQAEKLTKEEQLELVAKTTVSSYSMNMSWFLTNRVGPAWGAWERFDCKWRHSFS